MTTIHSDPFSRLDWPLILSLLETRYDVVCHHLAEEADADDPLRYRDDVNALIAQARVCARWAEVPQHWRRLLAGVMQNARRMWERDGADEVAVRGYLVHRVPPEHLDWALTEVYLETPDQRDERVAADVREFTEAGAPEIVPITEAEVIASGNGSEVSADDITVRAAPLPLVP